MILLLLVAIPVHAKPPEKIGKIFAQSVACHVAGNIEKSEKVAIDIRVIERYKVASQNNWWKSRMKAGKKKEFRRLNDTNKLELGIMCGILKDRWI